MNLFELFVKIGVDDQASGKISDLSSKLGNGLKTAAKIGTAAVAAAAAGITALTTEAVKNYAEYEQLVGGVETLFKESSGKVQKYAANAYKTAGMSANEYMSTVTSFSASLLQSLGGDTEKAADYADRAITDMADNANKMGTDISMIQNAYQGFAKQNYTMLDNLKLGYGGTKEEMERLLEDAEKISGIEYDLSSFSDITAAIHVMQEEMGIAGATAAEASGTISGSISAMKSAWTNLISGIASGNADVGELFEQFVDSAATAAENLIPAIGNVLSNIGKLIEEKGPDMIVQGALLLGKLAVGIIEGIPGLVSKIPQIVNDIIDGFREELPQFSKIGEDIVEGIWNGILALAGWIKNKVSNFFNGIVNGVKDTLGIHSPSRVFAGIGENMALGLGEGWSNEYNAIRRSVESDMDFGEGNVEFSSSGIGISSAGIVNGISNGDDSSYGSLTVNLMMPDGTKFASYLLPVLSDVAKSNGTPILNPQ